MKELTISNRDEGQRLNKYLIKYLGSAPSSFVYKMLRKKNIVLNGSKAKGDEILKAGDSIKLFLADETIDKFQNEKKSSSDNIALSNDTLEASNKKLNSFENKVIDNKKSYNIEKDILYIDDDIIVVNKPCGMLSQKADKNDYSINEAIIDYCLHNNIIDNKTLQTFKPSICNRLDRNTSGIILAGISLKGSKYLGDALKARTMDKYYYTIVKGNFKTKQICKGYIVKDNKANISKVISEKQFNALPVEQKKEYDYINTGFELVSTNGKYSLLKIELITGKSHQIRAHLKSLGYPVIGDAKYGDMQVNRYMRDKYKLKNHLLHAGEITLFNYEFNDAVGNKLVINAALPDIFKRICKEEGLKY